MAYQDRLDRTGKVYTITQQESAYGNIQDVETLALSNYSFAAWLPSAYDRKLIREELGLQSEVLPYRMMGEASTLLVDGAVLVDDADTTIRYKLLSVIAQKSLNGNVHHLAMVGVRQLNTTAEA